MDIKTSLHALSILCLMSTAAASPAPSTPPPTATPPDATEAGPELGIEAQVGRGAVHSYNRTDVDKFGNVFAGSLFLRGPAWAGHWHLGAGYTAAGLEGKDRERGFENQKLNVSTPFVDGRYLFGVTDGLELGLGLRATAGKGADFDVRRTEVASTNVAAGPVAGYNLQAGDWRFGVNASYLFNVNENERQVQMLLVGVSLNYALGSTVKAPPATTPAAVSAPAPAPALVQVPVNLDESVTNFAFGKSELSPELRHRVLALGRALAREEPTLGTITVAGHTDSVGPRRVNDPLSLARAQRVCDLFVRAGVDRRRLICVGYADTQLLSAYAPTARQQRRTALVMLSVREEYAAQVRKLIDQTMAH